MTFPGLQHAVEVHDVHGSALRLRADRFCRLWLVAEDESGMGVPVGLFDVEALRTIQAAITRHIESCTSGANR